MNLENIELDKDNKEFFNAVNIVENSNDIVYLTGKAGSGKTTFLKYIRKTTKKKTVVLAPTGVAALNAGGQTIHSFFKIPPTFFPPDDIRLRTVPTLDSEDKTTIYDHFRYRKGQKNLLKKMELLIIDEVSMVRADLLDLVDKLLRVFREKVNEPFGGVQVLLIGDAFQLPPITNKNNWDILKNYYETPFFFSANSIKDKSIVYIELKKIYRQQDRIFIDLLNRIRVNQVTNEDMDLINSRFLPNIFKNDNAEHLVVATHNRIVDEKNNRKLEELQTELKNYTAKIEGDFPESMVPTDKELKLKVGSQIMMIVNDPFKRFYNGKMGKITNLEQDLMIIKLEDGSTIDVIRNTWNNIKYTWNLKENKITEEIIGSFSQFPVKLAWAVTVHKCQGLTFDKIIADLSESFSPGQVYVALSRCTSLDGIVLKSRINRKVINTDPAVIKFSKREIENY